MSTSFGQYAPLVAAAGTLIAVGTALIQAWRKRAKWEPIEEDLPLLGEKLAGLMVALAIATLWYRHQANLNSEGEFLTAAWILAAALFASVLLYALLLGVFVFEREVVTADQKVSKQKVVGGFLLTEAARQSKKKHQITIQELFKGAAYDPDKVWHKLSRAIVKVALAFSYVGVIFTGTVALASASIAVMGGEVSNSGSSLAAVVKKWNEQAEEAKKSGTIAPKSPLPTGLAATRSAFETAWRSSSLAQKKQVDKEHAYKALSSVVGIYRTQESDGSSRSNAIQWADASIEYFEELQDRKWLVEALLDKAAILLELAQLENTSKDEFLRVSNDGDALVQRAAGIAAPQKTGEVLRIASRFYYNLARPKSFRLSDSWDNNYLLLAYKKAKESVAADPDDLKSANQLLRSAMKAAKNPPQDGDAAWGKNLRSAQASMKKVWEQRQSKILGGNRLPSLSVLGTGTYEAAAREWSDTPAKGRKALASSLADEVSAESLPLLQEAEALLKNDELKKAYGFDIYYDIARAHAQRTVMLRVIDKSRATKEFDEVISNLGRARENAKASQLDAAVKDIDKDISFSKLAPSERSRLATLLRVGAG